MSEGRYQPPPPVPGALRLHLNENTGGCSPAVLDAVRRVTPQEVSRYPDYDALLAACAAYLGAEASTIALLNGLDEGLLSAVVTAFRPDQQDGTAPGVPEGMVVLPAFEMYAIQIRAAGGRVVAVPSREDFAFPLDEMLAAVTPRTRIIFLTNPNNPTGLVIPRDAIRRLARDVPARVTIVLDEAYYEFCGETFLPDLPAHPNVVVGRTFAKAHGLAGLRAGCLVGEAGRLDPIRNVIPPFNVSVFTAVGWLAALRDRAHLARYQQQVAESKALVYAFCDRLGYRYWPSAGNFVLVRTGGDVPGLVTALAARGVLIKDRSREHGCEGCVRLTTGIVEHTRKALAAMEEILCAAR
jgi:histidinol-phosphate aminotransferase